LNHLAVLVRLHVMLNCHNLPTGACILTVEVIKQVSKMWIYIAHNHNTSNVLQHANTG